MFGVGLRENMPYFSKAVFLLDKVLLFSLFIIFISARIFASFLGRNHQGNTKTSGFTTILRSELVLFLSILIFSLWCLISAYINKNDFSLTFFGIFSYIVYFLTFFVFSSIPYKREMIKGYYRILLNFALFLSLVSVFQVILARIYPISVNWWPNIQTGDDVWRIGLYRAPSLLGHPNAVGIFALFFWTIEFARVKFDKQKTSFFKLIILGLAILFSLSRTAIAAAFIVPFIVSLRVRRVGFVLIPAVVLAAGLFFPYLNLRKEELKKAGEVLVYDEYRRFALDKSLEIWQGNPIFGVGPGMYGGHISLRFDSPVYAQYSFTGPYYDYLSNRVGSIEQQWVQALAEIGSIGFFLLVTLILTPIFILKKLLNAETEPFFKALKTGLMIMPLQMCVYLMSFTVTQQSQWLVLYFAFIGMIASAESFRQEKLNHV